MDVDQINSGSTVQMYDGTCHDRMIMRQRLTLKYNILHDEQIVRMRGQQLTDEQSYEIVPEIAPYQLKNLTEDALGDWEVNIEFKTQDYDMSSYPFPVMRMSTGNPHLNLTQSKLVGQSQLTSFYENRDDDCFDSIRLSGKDI